MRKFWESKKIVAFAACFLIAMITLVVNAKYDINIDANVILGAIGLSGLYVIAQGKIDAKKGDPNKAKSILESHKFVMVMLGNLMPMLVGILNKKFEIEITPEMIWGLLGIDAVYLIGKTSSDMKQPDAH